MKFPINIIIHMTELHIAIEKGNIEIVKILLTRQEIDVNILYILFKTINKILK